MGLGEILQNGDGDYDDNVAQERDKGQKGVISFEQLVEIFRIYEVLTLIGILL